MTKYFERLRSMHLSVARTQKRSVFFCVKKKKGRRASFRFLIHFAIDVLIVVLEVLGIVGKSYTTNMKILLQY